MSITPEQAQWFANTFTQMANNVELAVRGADGAALYGTLLRPAGTGRPPLAILHAGLGAGVPVVQGQDRHRRVDAAIVQRQALGARSDRGPARGPLGGHDRRGLDREHRAIRGLVGARARADVDHAARRSEGRVDARAQPRILAPPRRVAVSDRVVEHQPRRLAESLAARHF